MIAFEKDLMANPTDVVMVVGDVTSTMACSIVAKKMNTKVAHVEAGIRSWDLTMPEEINRMVTDTLSDYYFTTSETANHNLRNAGAREDQIFFVGNVMIDTLLANMPRFRKPDFFDRLQLENGNYLVLTLHRPANVDEGDKLRKLLSEIVNNIQGSPVVFPIHPRTAKMFSELNINTNNLYIVEPLGYLEFNYLVKHSKAVITDSGYGSEENYEFMEENRIEPFVKYNYFHKEEKKAFKNNAFLAQNLYYNEKEDYFVCPMGQHMKKVGDTTRTTESGYVSKISIYQAENCNGCPLRCLCHKSKTNRRIEVNHNLNRHKQKVRELLTSPEGLFHRSQRPIEPEAVFGQMKYDKAYIRFRHFGQEKVKADFALFATAFNIGKLYRKINKRAEKEQKNQQIDKKWLINTFIFIVMFRSLQKIKNRITSNQNLALQSAA